MVRLAEVGERAFTRGKRLHGQAHLLQHLDVKVCKRRRLGGIQSKVLSVLEAAPRQYDGHVFGVVACSVSELNAPASRLKRLKNSCQGVKSNFLL